VPEKFQRVSITPTAPSLFGPLRTQTEVGRVCTLEAVVYLLRELGGNCGGNGVTHAAAVRGGRGRGKARLEKAGGAGGAEGGNGEGVCQPVCQAGVEYVCGRVMRMFRVFVDRLARQSGRVGVGGVNVYAGYGSTKIQRMGSLSALPIALLHEVFRFTGHPCCAGEGGAKGGGADRGGSGVSSSLRAVVPGRALSPLSPLSPLGGGLGPRAAAEDAAAAGAVVAAAADEKAGEEAAAAERAERIRGKAAAAKLRQQQQQREKRERKVEERRQRLLLQQQPEQQEGEGQAGLGQGQGQGPGGQEGRGQGQATKEPSPPQPPPPPLLPQPPLPAGGKPDAPASSAAGPQQPKQAAAVCAHCGASFPSKNALFRHVRDAGAPCGAALESQSQRAEKEKAEAGVEGRAGGRVEAQAEGGEAEGQEGPDADDDSELHGDPNGGIATALGTEYPLAWVLAKSAYHILKGRKVQTRASH
jgi:hypothetical protein